MPWNVHQCCRHQAGNNVSQGAEWFVLNLKIIFCLPAEKIIEIYISIVVRSADCQVPLHSGPHHQEYGAAHGDPGEEQVGAQFEAIKSSN